LRVGTFKVPYFRLPKLLHDLSQIFDEYGEDTIESPTTNETLAHILGYQESNNGTYHTKLADLRAFGLLEGHGNQTKISAVGRKILLGEKAEREQAWRNAVSSIPLWNRLQSELGLIVSEFKPEAFRKTVVNITGCNASEAIECEKFLLNDYDDDTKPIRAIGKAKVIDIKAGTEHITYPFSKRGKKRAIAWLRGVKAH
jgi:hypothetical protein